MICCDPIDTVTKLTVVTDPTDEEITCPVIDLETSDVVVTLPNDDEICCPTNCLVELVFIDPALETIVRTAEGNVTEPDADIVTLPWELDICEPVIDTAGALDTDPTLDEIN